MRTPGPSRSSPSTSTSGRSGTSTRPILRDKNTDTDGLCDDERIYYLSDANFNITTLVNTGGDALERYVYSPYGVLTIYDATWSNIRSTSSYANAYTYMLSRRLSEIETLSDCSRRELASSAREDHPESALVRGKEKGPPCPRRPCAGHVLVPAILVLALPSPALLAQPCPESHGDVLGGKCGSSVCTAVTKSTSSGENGEAYVFRSNWGYMGKTRPGPDHVVQISHWHET